MIAGRLIFALSVNKSRLEQSFFPSRIENCLVSYHYIAAKSSEPGSWHLREPWLDIFERMRKKCKKVYIDSGIFSMKTQMVGTNVAGKVGTMSPEVLSDAGKKLKGSMKDFARFGYRYANFLRDYDHLYDWAFDLDVDEFLGLGAANKFYDHLRSSIKSPDKIIRIWHSTTRTFKDWIDWCKSGEYKYLGIEGGGSHNRDYYFYNRFVDVAHEHGIKVHVLAVTDPLFMKNVDVDSGDSSTWMVGSRFALVYTPYGMLSFGRKVRGTWESLSPDRQKQVLDFWKSRGLNYTAPDMVRNWVPREMANIEYFLWADRKYNPDSKGIKRHSFLSKVGL